MGRTIIEKFEEEASAAVFALVLFTPDDLVRVNASEYYQVRPNVLFELGWFCGRLGRSKTCIVCREGTTIPSDLDGISKVQFRVTVQEKIHEIERELKAAGLLT